MNKTATKKLREEFEEKYGFRPNERESEVYKMNWRKYKAMVKKGKKA